MDHHDDFGPWPDDPHDLGDSGGDPADLGGPDFDRPDPDQFTTGGATDEYADDLADADQPAGWPAADLLHESADDPYAGDGPSTPDTDPIGDLRSDPDDAWHGDDDRYADGGGHPSATFGADPDPVPGFPDVWGDPFPAPLDPADLPEPVDGHPWADADLLGGPHDPGWPGDPGWAAVTDQPPDPADLLADAGLPPAPAGSDPWQLLWASDDPAASALARWWAPPTGP